jgi:hypothetical protein
MKRGLVAHIGLNNKNKGTKVNGEEFKNTDDTDLIRVNPITARCMK